MNRTEQETPFSEKTIKFAPHVVYKFFVPFNRPRRLLKGWHLFPFHPVYGLLLYFQMKYFLHNIRLHNVKLQTKMSRKSDSLLMNCKINIAGNETIYELFPDLKVR